MGVFIMKKKIAAGVIAIAFGITALAMSFSIAGGINTREATDAFCYILDDVRVSS